MREVLQLCIVLDQQAHDAYAKLAACCKDPEFAQLFGELAEDELVHITWWSDLLVAWDQGLVPYFADRDDLLQRLLDIQVAVSVTDLSECEGWTIDDMLDVAVRYEYFMLDPLFADLLNLLEPGSDAAAQAYDIHVSRVIEAVEQHYTRPGLGSLLAGVLKRAFHDQLKNASLAMQDPLTGLCNRRGIYAHLEQWSAWSSRYRRSIGVLMVDLDHFKSVNDRFGHQAGDRTLVETAEALRYHLRSSDIVGRFGGDEFLIVLPETDRADVALLMDRIAESMRDATVGTDEDRLHLTASVGGAWSDGSTSVTPEALIALADRSLYAAKAAGRSRAGAVLGVEDL